MHMIWQYRVQETNVMCVRVHLPLKGFKKVYKSCLAVLTFLNYFAREANMTAPFCRTLKEATGMLFCNSPSLIHISLGVDDGKFKCCYSPVPLSSFDHMTSQSSFIYYFKMFLFSMLA